MSTIRQAIKPLALVLLVVALAVVAQRLPSAWASPSASPNRQTVPTPTPTPRPGPTATPVVVPQALFDATPNLSYAGPGGQADVVFIVNNNSGAALPGAQVVIDDTPGLSFQVLNFDRGEVVPGSIIWRLGDLAPGVVSRLTLRATTPSTMAPDACYIIRGTLTWTGGGPLVKQVSICAPASVLPKTGE